MKDWIGFSAIFLKKHGKDVFKEITNQIQSENVNEYSKEYVDIIFTIAFLTCFGVSDKKVIYTLGKIPPNKDINIKEMKEKHRKSISKIQKYIKEVQNETLKKYKK